MTEVNLKGIPASEGVAIGSAFCFIPVEPTVPARTAEDPQEEMARFDAAREQALEEVSAVKAKLLERTDEVTAAIFDAHALMLSDPMLHSAIQNKVEQGQSIEAAVVAAIEEVAATLGSMDEELFAARAQDVRDVGQRLLRILTDMPDSSLDALQQPSIIVAHDLTPSDTVGLQPELTLGFCTAAGGLTSHTAILARTLGIPAVVGLGSDALELIENDTRLVLNGLEGVVIVEPTSETVDSHLAMAKRQAERMTLIKDSAGQTAYTASGRRVEVGANVGDEDSARDAVSFGAEGVGLLRTEFLYLREARPPSEDHQIEAYRSIFEALAGRPVIIRTLDIGGDKPPTYVDFPDEQNPFLGWRGIRVCLDEPSLLKTQLRAILRAAVGHKALIMYPMISSVDELRQANAILDEARAELTKEGLEHVTDVPVGIMIETPASVALADVLATECDFFSIGTNDLTQYTLALDRTNERVAHLYQPLHPAVLRLIRDTVVAAHERGIWVGMCGELAGMKKAIPILVGLGLDELSMAPRGIPEAKWLIRQLTDPQARDVAQQAMSFSTALEVEELMGKELDKLQL